jgi:hypothetical protein
MNALPAALRALPLTFVIYVVEAVLALYCALPLSLELGADPRASLSSAIGRAVWLDRGLELLPALRVAGHSSLLSLALLLLLSPWLQVAWLSSMQRAFGSLRALEQGLRLYLRASIVSLLCLLVAVLLALPWAGAAWLADALLAAPARARLHDCALAVLLAPCALVLIYAHLVHDLARARALDAGAFAAVAFGLRAALRGRVLLAGLILLLTGLALRALQLYMSQRDAGLGAWLGVAPVQSASFAGLFVRSLWLATCLGCIETERRSRDPW